MLPFRINLQLGEPIYEQIVLVVKKAIATGQLQSERISQERPALHHRHALRRQHHPALRNPGNAAGGKALNITDPWKRPVTVGFSSHSRIPCFQRSASFLAARLTADRWAGLDTPQRLWRFW